MKASNIEIIKQKGFAFALILYPLMLFIGFITHPNLLKMEPLFTVEQLVSRFHNNPMYHIGHLIVTFAVPVIIIYFISVMNRLQGKGKSYGFWGGVLGIFGAFILAVDKGALCLTMSAFDTLPEDQFQAFTPYLQVIVDKEGFLFIVWLLFAMIIGGILQAIGLMKEKVIKKWQGTFIIIGLLLLINPDIELISSVGAALMCIAYIPWGIKELRYRKAKTSAIAHFDISADNVPRAKNFYEKLFGWKIEKFPFGPEYYLIETTTETGRKGVGGGIAHREKPYQKITNFIQVDSIDDSIAKVIELGGKIMEPKTAIPTVGFIAGCEDTEGNIFGLLEAA